MPKELVWFVAVAGKFAVNRNRIGTRRGWRKLTSYRQAHFALVWFRDAATWG